MTVPTIQATTIRDTYNELLPIFKNRDRRKLQPNTYARLDGSDIVIRYHETDILTYHGNDTVTIDTGGWHTTTTADRYRNWLPRMWSVKNDRGVWNVFGPVRGETVTYPAWSSGTSVTYPRIAAHFRVWDSMVITDVPRPLVVNYRQAPDFATDDALAQQLVAMIDSYVELYDAETCARFIPEGDAPISLAGDCFYCMGGIGGTGHLLSHLAEGYTMLSLVRNAYASRGYPDPGLIAMFELRNVCGTRNVRSTIRKYLTALLVPYGVPTVEQSDIDYAVAEAA